MTTIGATMIRQRSVNMIGAGGSQNRKMYDFGSGGLPSGVTFTRASAAWGFNSSGVLTQYATDAPRFVYDPATLQNLGLLVEGARTNSIRNSTAVGAVPGTPGTAPTNWTVTSAANAVTRTIVGAGVEDGIEYVDVQYSGTPSAGGNVVIQADVTPAVAATAQVWSASTYVRLVGGSLTNITATIGVVERVAGAFNVATTVAIAPTSAALRTQRFSVTRTFANATTDGATTDIRFSYTLGNAIDITLRIGLPQLELGASASSPIKTSTVAVLRNLDTARLTDARALTDPVLVFKGRVNAGALDHTMFQRDDGTNNNMWPQWYLDSVNLMRNYTIAGGTTQALLTTAQAFDADFAASTRLAANNFAMSVNGAAVVTDVSGTVPTGIINAIVGGAATFSGRMFGTIRSIETRATATDAELVALSTLPATAIGAQV